jgi:hypothetical protein
LVVHIDSKWICLDGANTAVQQELKQKSRQKVSKRGRIRHRHDRREQRFLVRRMLLMMCSLSELWAEAPEELMNPNI